MGLISLPPYPLLGSGMGMFPPKDTVLGGTVASGDGSWTCTVCEGDFIMWLSSWNRTLLLFCMLLELERRMELPVPVG